MIGMGKIRCYGIVSVVLFAITLMSLSCALASLANSHVSAIPDKFLDRVRGTNPSFSKAPNPNGANCTSWNVNIANSSGQNWVVDYGCLVAGTNCMTCAPKTNSVLVSPAQGALVYPKPIGIVDCNVPGGQQGTCQLFGGMLVCNNTGPYDCDQYAASYLPE